MSISRRKARLYGGPLVAVLVALTTYASIADKAHAAVTACSSAGLTSIGTQYGSCSTDQNGGSGGVGFTSSGLTASLSAKTQQGSEQVASFWSSNGPVLGTTICIGVQVNSVAIKGGGVVTESLALSHDGVQQPLLNWQVAQAGPTQNYCGSVPAGSSNVWWQLTTTAGGGKPASQAQVVQSLNWVTIV